VRKTILAALNMEGCAQIISNPNKPNIRYAVVNIDHNDIFGTFSHIINDIRENNIKASKAPVPQKGTC
jgi:superfamily II DNA helicase RecQ